ncbi:MAG: hypothetical protein JXR91_05445 [Deltaproteobacteria bacterium]|nr:hypothetical protein [Deltaproteobacteria bacterium]
MNTKIELKNKEIYIGVFLVGMLCLMLELIQVRMLSFFLGSISNFLAIPIALFGLAIGSMFFHYSDRSKIEKNIVRFSLGVFPVLLASFIIFFLITNTFFSEIHLIFNNLVNSVSKLLIYSGLFIPSYFIFGFLLSSYFTLQSHQIGKMYFFDLSGAALGCLITPLLFTYTDLPEVIGALLLFSLALYFNVTFKFKKVAIAAAVTVFVVIEVLSFNHLVFKEHPNIGILARTLMGQLKPDEVDEVSSRWNELTRTSLIRRKALHMARGIHPSIVVQDDGMSNVWFQEYNPGKVSKEQIAASHLHHTLPYAFGFNPRNILVMFAGVGKDMVLLDALGDGDAKITGVELNPAVVSAVYNPAVADHNLVTFFERPNINLVTEEGRDFLNQTHDKYDLIFVATNGAVNATRTGHTRKYLDTYEAMASYLDHLNKGGMIIFVNQPCYTKIHAFKKLFKERNMPDFDQAVIAFGYMHSEFIQSLVVRPDGLRPEHLRAVMSAIRNTERRQQIFYAPNVKIRKDFVDAMNATDAEIKNLMLTDDKPFRRHVTLEGFQLFPEKEKISDMLYAANWIKVFTVILFALVSIIVMLVARFAGGKHGRLPFLWLLYFLFSGISYMLVEIGLIAKTELFMGNPLYAVAVILAVFLLSNSLGAMAQDKYKIMRGPLTMIGYTLISIVWGIIAVKLFNRYLLSIPLIVKIIGVFIAVLPSGLVLGTFFPFGVSALVKNEKGSTIPLCYTLATLSSVLGSAFAMTAITNVGFSTVIFAGAIGYSTVALIYLAARRFSN